MARTLIHAAREKAPYGDVFVQFSPMQTLAAPDQFPFEALVRSAVQQAREPCERDGQFPAVIQNNAE